MVASSLLLVQGVTVILLLLTHRKSEAVFVVTKVCSYTCTPAEPILCPHSVLVPTSLALHLDCLMASIFALITDRMLLLPRRTKLLWTWPF